MGVRVSVATAFTAMALATLAAGDAAGQTREAPAPLSAAARARQHVAEGDRLAARARVVMAAIPRRGTMERSAWVHASAAAVEAATAQYAAAVSLGKGEPIPWLTVPMELFTHSALQVGLLNSERVKAIWTESEYFAKRTGWKPAPCSFTECWHPVEEVTRPIREVAKGALGFCLEYARAYMHWDEHATACEQALGALDKGRPALDELFPTPGWSGFALSGSPPDPQGPS